jgi:hypothetical protein
MHTTIKLTMALILATVALMSVVAITTPIQEASADSENCTEASTITRLENNYNNYDIDV